MVGDTFLCLKYKNIHATILIHYNVLKLSYLSYLYEKILPQHYEKVYHRTLKHHICNSLPTDTLSVKDHNELISDFDSKNRLR